MLIKKINQLNKNEFGVSEVLGVVLLMGITTILFSSFVLLIMTNLNLNEEGPQYDMTSRIENGLDEEKIHISYNFGPNLLVDEVQVKLRINFNQTIIEFEDGFSGDVFGVGDEWRYNIPDLPNGTEIYIQLFYESSTNPIYYTLIQIPAIDSDFAIQAVSTVPDKVELVANTSFYVKAYIKTFDGLVPKTLNVTGKIDDLGVTNISLSYSVTDFAYITNLIYLPNNTTTGLYSINISADGDGYNVSKTGYIKLIPNPNNSPPEITQAAVIPSIIAYNSSVNNVTVSVTISDLNGLNDISKVKVEINNTSISAFLYDDGVLQDQTANDGIYTCTLNITDLFIGNYQFKIMVTDRSAENAYYNLTFTVRKNLPPNLALPTVSPKNMSSKVALDTFIIKDNFTDGELDDYFWQSGEMGNRDHWDFENVSGNIMLKHPSSYLYGQILTGLATESDYTLRVKVRPGYRTAIVFRFQDQFNFWRLVAQNGNLLLRGMVDGSWTNANGDSNITFSVNASKFYWMLVNVTGDNFYGKMWQSTQPEPSSWMVIANETRLGSGAVGLGAEQEAYFDDFLVFKRSSYTPPIINLSVNVTDIDGASDITNVFATISEFGLNTTLKDDGIGYDFQGNDGIYSASVIVYPHTENGNYSIKYHAVDSYKNHNTTNIHLIINFTYYSNDLLINWKLDEAGGGIANDSSGYNNSGTIIGASWVNGVNGTGLTFDGSDDNIIINPFNTFPTNEITVSFWMKSSDSTKSGTPFSYATSNSNNEFLIFNYQSLRVYRGNKLVSTNIATNDGEWHHIVVTWQSSDGNVKLYKDGVAVYTGTLAAGTPIPTGGSLVIGQEQDNTGNAFDTSQAFKGTLDEIKVYKKILNSEEIFYDYNSTKPPPNPRINVQYHFNENSGTIAYDSMGDNDATVNGATWTAGINRSALNFDGIDDYVRINPLINFPQNEISAIFWMKSSDTTKNGAPISYSTSNSNNEFLIYDYQAFKIYRGNSYISTGIAGNDGEWHQFAVTWLGENGATEFYKDGISVYSGTLAPNTCITSGGSLVMGQEQDNVGNDFDVSQAFLGIMDEVTIYSRILTPAEILILYETTNDARIAHWNFDENSGSIAYDSINDNNGTINGATWTVGINGNALYFDGSNDFIDCGNDESLSFDQTDAFTIGAWVKTTDANGQIVAKMGGTPYTGYQFMIYQDRLSMFLINKWTSNSIYIYQTTSGTITDNAWHYVVVTYDGSSSASGMKLYLDGTEVGTTTVYNSLSGSTQTNTNLRIGLRGDNNWAFAGTIDEVIIYSKDLADTEILSYYNASKQGRVAIWYLDEGSGSTTYDSIGSNDGTITGASRVVGISGNALNFDGNGDYVNCGNDLDLNPESITISAWVKPVVINRWNHIVDKTGNAAQVSGYRSSITDQNKFRFRITFSDDSMTSLYSTTSAAANLWYHFVATYDQKEICIYLNGERDNSVNETKTIKHSSTSLMIGYNWNPAHTFFGVVDEVTIYNRALTVSEIQSAYNFTRTRKIVALWYLDENVGSTANDFYGDYDGIIHSATWISGINNSALSFDGSDDYIQPPGLSIRTSSATFTVTGWFKTGTSSNGPLWMWGDNPNPSSSGAAEAPVGWRASSGNLAAGFYSGGHRYAEASSDYADNNWHFVAQAGTSTTGRLYVDGTLIASTSHSYTYGSAPYILIGVRTKNSGCDIDNIQYFNGTLDEITAYGRALTAAEVQKIYSRGTAIHRNINDTPETFQTPLVTSQEHSESRSPFCPRNLNKSEVNNLTINLLGIQQPANVYENISTTLDLSIDINANINSDFGYIRFLLVHYESLVGSYEVSLGNGSFTKKIIVPIDFIPISLETEFRILAIVFIDDINKGEVLNTTTSMNVMPGPVPQIVSIDISPSTPSLFEKFNITVILKNNGEYFAFGSVVIIISNSLKNYNVEYAVELQSNATTEIIMESRVDITGQYHVKVKYIWIKYAVKLPSSKLSFIVNLPKKPDVNVKINTSVCTIYLEPAYIEVSVTCRSDYVSMVNFIIFDNNQTISKGSIELESSIGKYLLTSNDFSIGIHNIEAVVSIPWFGSELQAVAKKNLEILSEPYANSLNMNAIFNNSKINVNISVDAEWKILVTVLILDNNESVYNDEVIIDLNEKYEISLPLDLTFGTHQINITTYSSGLKTKLYALKVLNITIPVSYENSKLIITVPKEYNIEFNEQLDLIGWITYDGVHLTSNANVTVHILDKSKTDFTKNQFKVTTDHINELGYHRGVCLVRYHNITKSEEFWVRVIQESIEDSGTENDSFDVRQVSAVIALIIFFMLFWTILIKNKYKPSKKKWKTHSKWIAEQEMMSKTQEKKMFHKDSD